MDKNSYESLLSGDQIKSKEALKKFVEHNAKTFQFNSLNTSGQWSSIWKVIFEQLKSPEYSDIYTDCLSAIRILSRDKTHLNQTINNEQFDHLLNFANIGPNNIDCSTELSIEALKCLCNLVFNCTKCQEMCSKNTAVEGIVKRIRTYKDHNVDYFIQYFDMKLLFLITALNSNVRSIINDDLHGLTYLIETLDLLMKENKLNEKFTDKQVDLFCEILKVLFNLTVKNSISSTPTTTVETSNTTSSSSSSSISENDDKEETQQRRLAIVLHDLLLCETETKLKQIELYSNTVNLLTNITTLCFTELIPPVVLIDNNSIKNSFEGYYIKSINILLDFLKHQLETIEKTMTQHELLSPILTTLVKCVRCNSLLRRYIRTIILPPLIDVKKRPEEGNELRNHLCRLLTTPATQVRDLSAELLFVICKENVGRMIKHTGYGNAAGLLANRGLLGGRSNPTIDYSSDSEDSDTEEYKRLQHGINPVLGCYEAPRPNPLDGMTDEQKEFEAMKLVTLMDRLHRQGVVQPCRIDEDGRPVHIEHILELQDEIQQQQIDNKRKT